MSQLYFSNFILKFYFEISHLLTSPDVLDLVQDMR